MAAGTAGRAARAQDENIDPTDAALWGLDAQSWLPSDLTAAHIKTSGRAAVRVEDPDTGASQTFQVGLSAMLQHMRYFQDHLPPPETMAKGIPIDITVFCDVKIFAWLLKWVTARTGDPHSRTLPSRKETDSGDGSPPRLTVPICIPVLISSHFLKMHELAREAASFAAERLPEVALLGLDLTGLEPPLLGMLASFADERALEATWAAAQDPQRIAAGLVRHQPPRRAAAQQGSSGATVMAAVRDKIPQGDIQQHCQTIRSLVQKFYSHKVRRAVADWGPGLAMCEACSEVFPLSHAPLLECKAARMAVAFRGQAELRHAAKDGWHVQQHVDKLRSKGLTWRQVYWELWGSRHALPCARCGSAFTLGTGFECPGAASDSAGGFHTLPRASSGNEKSLRRSHVPPRCTCPASACRGCQPDHGVFPQLARVEQLARALSALPGRGPLAWAPPQHAPPTSGPDQSDPGWGPVCPRARLVGSMRRQAAHAGRRMTARRGPPRAAAPGLARLSEPPSQRVTATQDAILDALQAHRERAGSAATRRAESQHAQRKRRGPKAGRGGGGNTDGLLDSTSALQADLLRVLGLAGGSSASSSRSSSVSRASSHGSLAGWEEPDGSMRASLLLPRGDMVIARDIVREDDDRRLAVLSAMFSLRDQAGGVEVPDARSPQHGAGGAEREGRGGGGRGGGASTPVGRTASQASFDLPKLPMRPSSVRAGSRGASALARRPGSAGAELTRRARSGSGAGYAGSALLAPGGER
ncbi:unnamed protein product [Pedinophyceae sp. YPF-701]|nr:unnamed protein product [Pedinophyceae sp. YPF-701]